MAGGRKVELECGVIWIYDRFLVNEMHEGTLLDVETNQKILKIGDDSFEGHPFGYISHRINSYAVNPLVYRDSADHPQLKVIAVVSKSERARESARLEQQFYPYKNAFKIFNSLPEAITWVQEVLISYSASQKSLRE